MTKKTGQNTARSGNAKAKAAQEKKARALAAKKRAEQKELTGRVLAAMLRENTGRALLDSGDYYGRHWERNQKRDIENESGATLNVNAKYGQGEISVTLRLYHFLLARVCRDERATELQEQFEQFAELPENDCESWEDNVNTFTKKIGARQIRAGYTYNEENWLDQDFLYYVFDDDGNDGSGYRMCFLQSHNGCDARGGFTKPQCFALESESEFYDLDRGTIWCANGHWWDFEGGYRGRWHNDDGIPDLETFEIAEVESDESARASDMTKLSDEWREYVALVNSERLPGLGGVRPALPEGAVIFVENDVAHCPICGGALSAEGASPF